MGCDKEWDLLNEKWDSVGENWIKRAHFRIDACFLIIETWFLTNCDLLAF